MPARRHSLLMSPFEIKCFCFLLGAERLLLGNDFEVGFGFGALSDFLSFFFGGMKFKFKIIAIN
jgi:hypothetical protein